MRIEDIEGIGQTYAAKLVDVGVSTTDALLAQGADAAGRARLADASGISGTLILEWVNHVDLMRIDGVGSEYSDLLEAAGVDSPPELAQRNAANLAVTLQEVVAARPEIVRRIPTESEVAGWIAQARTLPKVVTHGGSASAASVPAPESAPFAAAAPADPPAATPAHDHADHAGHDHGEHDHGEHAGHDHAEHDRGEHAGHDHGAAPSAPAPAARSLAGSADPGGDGWWARIKRLFGG
jgi:predicted flap endonuclease-1-like 5' DNA nuclease